MLSHSQIKSLIKALQNDEIVIMPTDTIYSLSAKASRKNQIKINRLKKSPLEKPLIALISNEHQLKQFVDEEIALEFSHFLNQGITLVFPHKKDKIQTIAIRLIKKPDLVQVLEQVGPLWSTSVNFSGNDSLTNLEQMKVQFSPIKIFSSNQTLNSAPSKIYDTIYQKWLR